ncbi:hypothetical protein EC988_002449 [Linderina pennispora]|nr:hypothetical protein EC988_002449 [Linderina pennispora]
MNVYVFGSSKLPCAVGMFVAVAVFTLALLLLNSNRVGIRLPYEPKEVYTDALNSTLGFHKIYATYDPAKSIDKGNLKAAADLLNIQIEYVPRRSLEEATKQREERGYLAPVPDIAEFITHMAIYKDMAEFNIQSALILDSSIDMELDLKMRLASALGNGIAASYDLLFIGREFSEESEPGIDDVTIVLKQTKATKSSSERCLRHWTKVNFLNRQPLAFRTSYPHGTHAYVIFAPPFDVYRNPASHYYQPRNATLGFQKIFVLNMPARHDRLRNMRALASYHRLKLEFVRTFGERESNELARTLDYPINGTHLACYLSHLNIYKHMVEYNIETALIVEDDIDVELDLKDRHAYIMSKVHEVYGRDWDMLYLGRCTFDSNEPAKVVPTLVANGTRYAVDPSERARYLQRDLSLFESEYPMCLHAYAVTRECAKRLSVLLQERLKSVGKDIDLILAVGARAGVSTILGTSPPYFVQVGRQELPSDLTAIADGDTAQRLAHSTLYHLHLRTRDPQSLAPYMDWPWFVDSV